VDKVRRSDRLYRAKVIRSEGLWNAEVRRVWCAALLPSANCVCYGCPSSAFYVGVGLLLFGITGQQHGSTHSTIVKRSE
jgi:hypothetical protein